MENYWKKKYKEMQTMFYIVALMCCGISWILIYETTNTNPYNEELVMASYRNGWLTGELNTRKIQVSDKEWTRELSDEHFKEDSIYFRELIDLTIE